MSRSVGVRSLRSQKTALWMNIGASYGVEGDASVLRRRPWLLFWLGGEWLGALSGALYLPFEMRHTVHRPTLATAVVSAANVAVCFLSWQLWRRRRTSVA